MPVEGVTLSQVSDTWGAARSEGRTHEGVDIFAEAGTPVYSATSGYVEWFGPYGVGGNTVTVVGAGGVRYYYAHLSGYAEGLTNGQAVTPDTPPTYSSSIWATFRTYLSDTVLEVQRVSSSLWPTPQPTARPTAHSKAHLTPQVAPFTVTAAGPSVKPLSPVNR